MKHTRLSVSFVGLLAAIAALSCGEAQAQEFPVVTSVETNYVGLGFGVMPDYVGSDEYTFGVLPAFRYEFGNHRNVELVGNYLSANLIDHDVIRFGPAFRYRFGRDDVDDSFVDDLPDISDTVEGGLMLSGTWILGNDPRERFTIGTDTLWDLGKEHEGFVGTVYGRYWTPVSEAIDLGLMGNIQYGDDNYTETYFNVTPAGSAASGLPTFTADGGLNSFSLTPMMAFHINQNWHVSAGLRYVRLTGDSEDSPIVDPRGDADQFIGGVGLIYTWGMKAHSQ